MRSAFLLSSTMAVGLLAVAGPSRAAPSGMLLADIPIDAPGAGDADAALRATLAPSLALLDGARTRQLREQARQLGLACDIIDEPCAVGFGQLVSTDEVVTVKVERLAGGFWLRAARVSPKTGRSLVKVAGRLTERANDGGQPIAPLVAGLFGEPPLATVPVRVAVDRPDATVRVDNVDVTRVDGVAWLLPGTHNVVATAGRGRASTQVNVVTDGTIALVSLALVDGPQTAAPTTSDPAAPHSGAPTVASGTSWAPGSPAVAGPPPVADEPGGWLMPGVMIGGAVVAGLGAIWWASVDASLTAPLSRTERGDRERLGQLGAGTTALGVIACGAGAVLWALE